MPLELVKYAGPVAGGAGWAVGVGGACVGVSSPALHGDGVLSRWGWRRTHTCVWRTRRGRRRRVRHWNKNKLILAKICFICADLHFLFKACSKLQKDKMCISQDHKPLMCPVRLLFWTDVTDTVQLYKRWTGFLHRNRTCLKSIIPSPLDNGDVLSAHAAATVTNSSLWVKWKGQRSSSVPVSSSVTYHLPSASDQTWYKICSQVKILN